jgi:Flp pilus assembly protein TadD
MNLALNGLETEKGNPYLYQYLATAQIQQADLTSDKDERVSRYRSAVNALGTAHTLAPQDKTFTLALALAYDQLGQFDEAESMYKETIALDPNLPWIKQNYEAFLQRGRDRAEKSPPSANDSPKPKL